MKKNQVKFYYVYLITNLVLNKSYIGSRMCYHNNIEDDNYMGSSKYLNKDYEIYGIRNFIKKILQSDYTNKINMLNGESHYMYKYNTLSPYGYNKWDPVKSPGWHTGGSHHSKETKEKISNSLKGKSPANKGITMSEESKSKIREAAKNRKPISEETRLKLSKSHKGQIAWNKGQKKITLKNKGEIILF